MRLDRLDDEGRQFLSYTCKDPLISQFHQLAQNFRLFLTTHSVALLDTWLDTAQCSLLRQVRTFASFLRDDYAAFCVVVEQPSSNGQTKGQVHHLKCIKRQMYGRASFALLRQKVRYYPDST